MPQTPTKGDGPPLTTADHPDVSNAITQARITRPAVMSGHRRAASRRGHPLATASLYEPAPGRGRFWLSLRCPFCRGVHLCRLRDESEAGGQRRTPCGRVFVVVRQRFRTSQGATA
jgi:hypothetical protein